MEDRLSPREIEVLKKAAECHRSYLRGLGLACCGVCGLEVKPGMSRHQHVETKADLQFIKEPKKVKYVTVEETGSSWVYTGTGECYGWSEVKPA